MKAVVVGAGAVGARVGRQLLVHGSKELTMVGRGSLATRTAVSSLGHDVNLTRWQPSILDDASVLVLTAPHDHASYAKAAIERGVSVVSVADSLDEVQELLALDNYAREHNATVAVGAGFVPGLSCVLAQFGAQKLDELQEVRIAKYGTGGPACARTHHSALANSGLDWRDNAWLEGAGGSARELCWFPDPIGGVDCYRAAMPDAVLLQRAFPSAERISARLAATRRDRVTARVPMMRKPHPEGLVGGARVELRGQRKGQQVTDVYGVIDRPAAGAAVVAALTAEWLASKRIEKPGVSGLAELFVEPNIVLSELADRGVKCAVFEGSE